MMLPFIFCPMLRSAALAVGRLMNRLLMPKVLGGLGVALLYGAKLGRKETRFNTSGGVDASRRWWEPCGTAYLEKEILGWFLKLCTFAKRSFFLVRSGVD